MISDQGAIHTYGPYPGRRTFVQMQFFVRVLERLRLKERLARNARHDYAQRGRLECRERRVRGGTIEEGVVRNFLCPSLFFQYMNFRLIWPIQYV